MSLRRTLELMGGQNLRGTPLARCSHREVTVTKSLKPPESSEAAPGHKSSGGSSALEPPLAPEVVEKTKSSSVLAPATQYK